MPKIPGAKRFLELGIGPATDNAGTGGRLGSGRGATSDNDDESDDSGDREARARRKLRAAARRAKREEDALRINLAHCKYSVVHECAQAAHWKVRRESVCGAL